MLLVLNVITLLWFSYYYLLSVYLQVSITYENLQFALLY